MNRSFGLISDVAEHRRSTLANEANRRKPKQSRIQGRTNSLQHGCLLSGRIARQTRAEFAPIEALAAPEVRIHPAPPTSQCEPIPVVASFRGLNENRVIGKVHARTPDHADKSRRGNHKKCACGGDAPAPPAPKRALVVVRTISFKLLYGLVILRHARRRLVRISVTTNPTAELIVGQVTDAFPWDEGPRH